MIFGTCHSCSEEIPVDVSPTRWSASNPVFLAVHWVMINAGAGKRLQTSSWCLLNLFMDWNMRQGSFGYNYRTFTGKKWWLQSFGMIMMPLMENWNSPLQPLTNAPDCTISLKRGSGPGDWIRRLLATRTSCNANGLVHESIEPAKWKHRRHSPELYPGSIPLALQYCHIIFVLSTCRSNPSALIYLPNTSFWWLLGKSF